MLLDVLEKWNLIPQGMPGKRHHDYSSRLIATYPDMDASGDANDWEKQIEQMKKDMEEWKAKEAHVPKPNPEPKPHTELPQEDKDRIEEAVKSCFNFQMTQ